MQPRLNHLIAGLLLGLACCLAFAAPKFPSLTGRVIDNANLLSPEVEKKLDAQLEAYEQGTTNQVVVVTLASLEGYAIDDYGYQLGRYWQIGQKGKNNGVLLIVAPKERKVRIEVGYGLEPLLTDALSNTIIQNVILPQFKKGDYQQGIVDGTQSILDVLGGKTLAKNVKPEPKTIKWLEWIFFIIIILLFVRNPGLAFLIFSGSGQRFGGSGRGGFGGGGGSFGGGGSSGSW